MQKNITLFCIVDHSGLAAGIGVAMLPTKLFILGNPKAGTPLMAASPSAALDLPLKILIAEQRDGSVVVSWNDPAWLQQRHGFSPDLISNIAGVEAIARSVCE
ncbi:MAG TPA: DUF302 domain-containing protein [Silvibacterium sp.]|nr:DUF302 domain-containing protein [Silvibacterium sp.]